MDTLDALGLSSFALTAGGVVFFFVRRCLRSKCVRGDDGMPALNISLQLTEEQKEIVKESAELALKVKEIESRMNEIKQVRSTRGTGGAAAAEAV